MAASGTEHAVVHAEYEYGDDADALNEAVGKLVSENPDKFSGYGTISMNPVKIPRALAQVRRVAELGLTGLSLQPSFFGIADRRPGAVPGLRQGRRTRPARGPAHRHQLHGQLPDPQRPAAPARSGRLRLPRPGADRLPRGLAVGGGDGGRACASTRNVYAEFGGLAPRYVCEPNTGWEVMKRFMNSLLSQQVLHGTDWPVFPMDKALAQWRAGRCANTCWRP